MVGIVEHTEGPTSGQQEDRLSPPETRRALWVAAVAWGVFGSAWASMVSGAPYVSFVREKLGASTLVFGLFSSLPFLGVLAQLPGAWWVEHARRRRSLFIVAASGSRFVWFLVAALPWVIPEHHPSARLGALLALVVIGSTLGHAGTPAWLSWFADMVPENIRGRYLGNRAALATITAVIVSATISHVIDRDNSFRVFTAIFCVAAAVGLADVELFWLVREPAMPLRGGRPWRLRNVILGPLSDKPFRGYLLYVLSEAFMFGFAGPFFWLMGLEGLGIGKFWCNAYIMVVPMIFAAATLSVWGGVADRFGSRPLVTLGTVMTIVFPVCWMLARPGYHHVLLATAAVIGGLFGAAIQVGDMNMLFSLTPRETRSAYLAVLSLAASLGWAVAPALAGTIGQALKPVQFQVAGATFGNLHLLMAMSIVLRLVHTLVVIPRLPEVSHQSTGALLRHLLVDPFVRVARWVWRPSGGPRSSAARDKRDRGG